MQGSHELTDRDAYAQLVGATYPWLAESEIYRASDFLSERMEKYDVYASPKFTHELASAAEQLGHDLAAEFDLSTPSLGTSAAGRAFLQAYGRAGRAAVQVATDVLQKIVGLGR